MSIVDELAGQDLLAMFADWGRPALLEEVLERVDVLSGHRERAVYSTSLSVLLTDQEVRSVTGVASVASARQVTFLLRRSDVSPSTILTSCRIRFEERIYSIESVEEPSPPGTWCVHGLELSGED